MIPLTLYITKVILCSAVFAGFYTLVLKNAKLFAWNRFYQLGAVFLSFVIPFIALPADSALQDIPVAMLSEKIIFNDIEEEAIVANSAESSVKVIFIFGVVYLAVAFAFLLVDMFRLLKLIRLRKQSEKWEVGQYRFYITDKSPFSFLNSIFWNKSIDPNSNEGRCVLNHEMVHVENKHGVDKLVMQAVCSIAWINPVFRYMKYELDQVHEFEADSISACDNTALLSSSILCSMYPEYTGSFTGNFFPSPIKRRLDMVNRTYSSSWALLQRVMTIAVFFVTTVVFASETKSVVTEVAEAINKPIVGAIEKSEKIEVKRVERVIEEQSTVMFVKKDPPPPPPKIVYKTMSYEEIEGIEPEPPKNENKNYIVSKIEQKPAFPGGNAALKVWLSKNLDYPKKASENNVQGRVVAQFTITETGSIEDIIITRSVDSDLDNETIRMVKSMPRWIPGRLNGEPASVRYSLPVSFRLKNT